jgi:hypothetical protein
MDDADVVLGDEGHSVMIDDFDDYRCVGGALGLPDWIAMQMENTDSGLVLWNTVTFGEFTISWTGQGDDVIVYDSAAGGGEG